MTITLRRRTTCLSLLLTTIMLQSKIIFSFIVTTQRNNQLSTTRQLITTSISATSTKKKMPGTADMGIAWEDLGFEFRPTNSHIEIKYKQNEDGTGSWGEPTLVKEPYVKLHIGATALHYGQSCFEGLKAFCHKDNTIHIFRPKENAKRMQSSCRRTLMAELPTELFIQACEKVIKDNIEYIPPYGSNGALYIRPLLFGSGPRIGLQPADEYTFILLVIPVGDYYHGGLSTPVNGRIILDYDRAAPRGVGNVKVAGNYAADLLPNQQSKKQGYPIGLYLDAKTQTQIEEFSTSNFAGIIHKTNTYVTPKSPSVLPSITNKSLMQIAKDMGMTVEERVVSVEELDLFDEVLAVGTAVVVTPVGSITYKDHTYQFGDEGQIGPSTLKLYERVRAIQNGEYDDIHNWNYKVEY